MVQAVRIHSTGGPEVMLLEEVEVDAPEELPPLPAAVEVAAYRIAQEAVNNALRHGKASQIRISLLQIKGETILEVMDNGVGFDPSSFARSRGSGVTGGFGLGIMAYRAGIIGGTLRTMQLDEGGILVRCAIPAGGGNQQ